jgi:opacity protein-like surface antigen
MRSKLLGVALAALTFSAAFAGELPGSGKIQAPVSKAHADEPNWNRTGMYVAAIGAYDVSVLNAEGFDLADGKLMAGAAVGWNWRVASNVVLGLEGDWMFTGVKGSREVDELVLRASMDHLASIRGRAGITAGPALLYLTLGPAWQSARLTIGEGDDAVSERKWQLGVAFGGGAEVELTRSLALRLEALHYIFPNDGAPLSDFLDSDNQHTAVRAGVVFKLN